MKKLIALLLAISLVASLLPLAALAEEDVTSFTADALEDPLDSQVDDAWNDPLDPQLDDEEDDSEGIDAALSEVTAEEVADAIADAQLSEAAAGLLGTVTHDPQTVLDEALAAINQQFAENRLEEAQDVIEDADEELEAWNQEAQQAQQEAEAAAEEAENQQEQAEIAADAAEEAVTDVIQAADRAEAEVAAEEAEKQSQAAADAANEALIQSATAAQKAEDAKQAYESAVQAAADAEQEAQELLSSGLITMEEAKDRTQQAADRANQKYEEMLAAQGEAEKAADVAKAEADAAKDVLAEATKDLNQAIVENTANITNKTATVVATGVALEATKVAVGAAEQVVNYYDGKIADLQEQVDQLDTAIQEANIAIEEARKELEALGAEDAEYAQAQKALEDAENAKKAAEDAYAKAEEILNAKAEAETSGKKAQMEELQGYVSDGTATAQQKQELAKLVLADNLAADQLGNIQWDENNDSVFWIVDENGELVLDENGQPQRYEVVTTQREDGTSYLQFHKSELKTETKIDDLPNAKDLYNEGQSVNIIEQNTHTTVLKAYDENNNAVNIVAYKSLRYPFDCTLRADIGATGILNPALASDADGFYYEYGGTKVRVTVVDTTVSHYETAENALGTNSDSITNQWTAAENAEENLQTKTDEYFKAKEDFDAAEKTYKETQKALNTIIDDNNAIVVANQEQVDQLNDEISALDKKLNGDLSDKILRSMIEGSVDEELSEQLSEDAKRLAHLIFKINKTEEEKAELRELLDRRDELEEIQQTGGQIAEIIAGVADGNIQIDDVKNVIDLLGNADISAKTRAAIARALQDTMQDAYDQASADLKDAYEQAKQELSEKREALKEASEDVIEKELVLVNATAKVASAKQAADTAKRMKDAADQAAADAKAAYEKYAALMLTTDQAAIAAAKKAWEDAQANADAALAAHKAAVAAAERADAAALSARKIANAYPVPSEDPDYIVVETFEPPEIAEYAYTLVSNVPVGFVAYQGSSMANPIFVETLFASHGYMVSLSSKNPNDIIGNGVLVDSKPLQPGDLVCIYNIDGTVIFGIYYGNGIYIFFNEATGLVETAKCPTDTSRWFAVRVYN